jgi:tRNA A-37 threonylcarbamoyl transferase component Bud32
VRLYLVSRFREDIFPLEDVCDLATLQSARKLLRVLLRIVAQLHQFKIVHNDICLSTVFVAGVFDPDSTLDNVFLAGFPRLVET